MFTHQSPELVLNPERQESHQRSPHRGPSGAQRGVPPEGGVHEATHNTNTRAGDLEDAEDEHALLVENEVPVPGHVRV